MGGKKRTTGANHAPSPLAAAGQAPIGWPSDVEYLPSTSVPSANLASFHASIFCQPPAPDATLHPARLRSLDSTAIRPITEPSHPAHGQCGLFAKREIPPRTVVAPYLGVVHTEKESDEKSDYDLKVWAPEAPAGEPSNGAKSGSSLTVPLGIDATHKGSEARFVNDYRGIGERPNVFFEEMDLDAPMEEEEDDSSASRPRRRGLVIRTGSKPIKAGQELLVSYGKGFWAARRSEAGQDIKESEEGRPDLTDSERIAAPNAQHQSTEAGKTAATRPANDHVQAMLERQRARLKHLKVAVDRTT